MLFNSLDFAVFFPVFCVLYFLTPYRTRTLLVLMASCVFYMAFIPAYLLILALTIGIDYTAGLLLERSSGTQRRALLIVSVVATCAVLFVFKYFNFFIDTFVASGHALGVEVTGPAISIILPIGLSFHTFQSLSYVIEVYYKRQRAERDLITYAAYVMFFPQLVAGPIERPQNLIHQFRETHDFDYERIVSGLKRMAWGFFKKVVIADRLALYVNDVYASPQSFNGLQLSMATVFFAYQIYCDFSGYSDIAIGSARVLGFRLMENFKTPYYSASVSEFWRRWHISLSTWFRDYVYLPQGGNRVGKARWFSNLLTTFALSGLWHGANWTYVVWGALNGVYLIAGSVTKPLRDRCYQAIGVDTNGLARTAIGVSTTFGLTCCGWVIFRAESLSDAWYIFTHFWRAWDVTQFSTEQFPLRQMPVALLSIAFLEIAQLLHTRRPLPDLVGRRSLALRWPVYVGFVLAVVLLGVYRQHQFIYFQF